MSEQGVATPPVTEQIGNVPPPQPSLRDELSHAFKEIQDKGEKPNPNVNAPAETQETKEARQRDQEGKFKAPTTEKPGERKTITLPEKTAAAPEAKPVNPPASWTPAAKAKFAGLDPEIQQEVLRREGEMTKQFGVIETDRTLGKKIRETAAPYLATIKAEGGTEEAAFGAFLNYAHIMRSGTPQQKLAALQTVAQQYNVPLGSQPQQAAPNQAFESLAQRLDRLERERQAEIQQRQVQEQSALHSEIESFAAEPGHEHYEQVKVLMGNLLLSEQAKTLQEAYDQAIWANPEIRSTLTAAQAAEVEQKRLAANQQQTGAAKWASGSVVGNPGGITPKSQNAERSLGDEIRANMRAATGRV